jgi:alpha-L-fucosidase
MKVNGEAIYGTGPTPFGAEAGAFSDTEKDRSGKPRFIASWEWRATTKPGKIYLEIFQWPTNGQFGLPGLQSQVKRAYLLASHKALEVRKMATGVALALPEKAPDAIASVVCVEIADAVARVTPAK